MSKPYYITHDVSLIETHYTPMGDLPHKLDEPCPCQPDVYIGHLNFKVEHRPFSALCEEQ